MTAKTEGRIRLTVLGGYLGSGKTTWLRHQLHEGKFRNAYVIVNEAAETPVDDALLGQSTRLSVLAGGCVCCTAKADLIALLRSLCDERSRGLSDDPRLEQIVLETSGLADPGPIVEAIKADPVLVYHIVVSEVVVAVDALHALSQLTTEPLGRRQIEVADRLIITKADVAEEGAVKALLATLRTLNPLAVMSGASKGVEVPLPGFDGIAPVALPDLANQPARPADHARAALYRRQHRLDGFHGLAIRLAARARRRHRAGERRRAHARRTPVAADGAQGRSIARNPSRAGRHARGQYDRRHRPRLHGRPAKALAQIFRRPLTSHGLAASFRCRAVEFPCIAIVGGAQHHAIDVMRVFGVDEVVQHIVEHQQRIAVERITIAAA